MRQGAAMQVVDVRGRGGNTSSTIELGSPIAIPRHGATRKTSASSMSAEIIGCDAPPSATLRLQRRRSRVAHPEPDAEGLSICDAARFTGRCRGPVDIRLWGIVMQSDRKDRSYHLALLGNALADLPLVARCELLMAIENAMPALFAHGPPHRYPRGRRDRDPPASGTAVKAQRHCSLRGRSGPPWWRRKLQRKRSIWLRDAIRASGCLDDRRSADDLPSRLGALVQMQRSAIADLVRLAGQFAAELEGIRYGRVTE
jgi:hypothetical protein